jgi:hypothetical protein
MINKGIVNNAGAIAIASEGSVVNDGIVENTAEGTIDNKGEIDNTGGTINNEGTFESVQTKEEMGGDIEGEVQAIESPSNGGSSGCNAGFGMFGLLFAGLAALKHRKA